MLNGAPCHCTYVVTFMRLNLKYVTTVLALDQSRRGFFAKTSNPGREHSPYFHLH